MPTEIRHIVFDEEELFGAIRAYRDRRRSPLPDRSLRRIVMQDDEEIQAHIQFESGNPADDEVVVIDSDELAMAMILYCIDHKIPLPVHSAKAIQVFGGSVGLVINRRTAVGVPASL